MTTTDNPNDDETTKSFLILADTMKTGPNDATSFFTQEHNWFSGIQAEILAPQACIHKEADNYYFKFEKTANTSEISVIIIIAVTFVMLILIYIGWRSKNPYITDWFRVISIYSAATLLFVFILQLGPSTPGFSRFVGFAVVIHNFAELYLIRNVWFGKQSNSFIGNAVIVLYVFLMTTFLAFMPMNALYLIAMVQGASMDYLFCITFPVIASKFKSYQHNCCDFVLASAAAIIHITSIQPLFIGFALSNVQITGITTLGLFPTFFLYTYFAGRELGRLGFLGPSFDDILQYVWSIRILRNIREIQKEMPNKSGNADKQPDNTEKQQPAEFELEVLGESNLSSGTMADDAVGALMRATGDANEVATTDDKKRAREFAIQGAIAYFKMPAWEVTIIFVSAFLLALGNGLLIWYSPSYASENAMCKG